MDPEAVSRVGRKLDYEQALFFSWSIEQNARDTQMITRVTEGATRPRFSSRGLATRGSRACSPLN